MHSNRRVVVTGMGLVCPLGNDVASSWARIVAGESGIGPIECFDASAFTTRFGGSVKGLDISAYIPAKDARKLDLFIQYGMAAAIQAVEDSGLVVDEQNAHRVGALIGSGIGGVGSIEACRDIIRDKGPRRVLPYFVPGSVINMIAGNISIRYGFTGPNLAMATACSTGTHSIGLAARLIAAGDADVMVAGGAEMAMTTVGIGVFAAARALSTRNDDPQSASRPWDRDRDGFVLSDGAGVMVLEEYETARRRGAAIYAELSGFGMSADAFHVTAPPPEGRGAAMAMTNAMADAGIGPDQIDYINAHGTSTPAGDVAESLAIELALGDSARRVAISSTKSMVGHMLGAAGAVEAIFSVLALRDQVVPPTINLDNPGEGCRLDYVPHVARDRKLDVCLSNSFGFGGTNGSLLFRKI